MICRFSSFEINKDTVTAKFEDGSIDTGDGTAVYTNQKNINFYPNKNKLKY